jgi:hypothetical protein
LKNAYAASAFREVAASSAELVFAPGQLDEQNVRQTKDIPDDIDEVLEELGITLHQENVGGVGDSKGSGYHIGWPVRRKASPV